MISLLKEYSTAFGPSGFEEDILKLAAHHLKGYHLENDALHNLYAYGKERDKGFTIQLDAHMDECGFMVQAINDNGSLAIVALGGINAAHLPSHAVRIRTREGKLVRGVIAAKPVHFTQGEKGGALTIESLLVDVGATSRKEVEKLFGISLGDPMVMDVDFFYNEKTEICLGKSFDNRAGCACLTKVLQSLEEEQDALAVNLVGTFSVQEELGLRGVRVAAERVKPDLAIVFEGAPSDDFFVTPGQAQGALKKGVQLRLFDSGHLANQDFVAFAREVAKEEGIPFQETVRRGGGTNAGQLHLSHQGVPTLVLSVPARYIHSHYNYCAKADMVAAVKLALIIVRRLDEKAITHILRQDILR